MSCLRVDRVGCLFVDVRARKLEQEVGVAIAAFHRCCRLSAMRSLTRERSVGSQLLDKNKLCKLLLTSPEQNRGVLKVKEIFFPMEG